MITENNLQSVTILINEKDLVPVKSILNVLKEKYPKFSTIKFRTGNIGENILVSFKVYQEYYSKVLENFAYNDVPVITKDKSAQDFIDKKKEQKRIKIRAQGWSDISLSKEHIALSELEKLSSNGKIKEIVKEAQGDVGSNIEIVKKAKNLISLTINNAIENLIRYSEEHKRKTQNAIDELLSIASDKSLKLFQKGEEMKKAGDTAILLSLSDSKYYSNLIEIANNSKLNNNTNVKAALVLAGFIFDSTEEEIERLPDVVKLTNTRWLKIAFESIQQKLSQEETDSFNKFVNFIEDERRAA